MAVTRLCVSVPDELVDQLRAVVPDVNVSGLLQDAMRALLGCRHEELRCARCAAAIDKFKIIDDALGRFYLDVTWDLHPLVTRGGTAEGAARVLKSVGERHQISAAKNTPLPRPTRGERQANKVAEFPPPARSRRAGGSSTIPHQQKETA